MLMEISTATPAPMATIIERIGKKFMELGPVNCDLGRYSCDVYDEVIRLTIIDS